MEHVTGIDDYCRALEAYLCRKNDGHLIRVVGPAFERVCAWADAGVPLKVACRGIDRYFDRYYAKGPRRRPVRIEFCEADVLDVFDEWRRAVGVAALREMPARYAADGADPREGDGGSEDEPEGTALPGRPRASLPAHLDRAAARLAGLRAGDDRSLDEVLDDVLAELKRMKGSARGLRGEARHAAIARLRALDAMLLASALARIGDDDMQRIRLEAEAELAPFRPRMNADAYDRATASCIGRIVRERARLPILIFE